MGFSATRLARSSSTITCTSRTRKSNASRRTFPTGSSANISRCFEVTDLCALFLVKGAGLRQALHIDDVVGLAGLDAKNLGLELVFADDPIFRAERPDDLARQVHAVLPHRWIVPVVVGVLDMDDVVIEGARTRGFDCGGAARRIGIGRTAQHEYRHGNGGQSSCFVPRHLLSPKTVKPYCAGCNCGSSFCLKA